MSESVHDCAFLFLQNDRDSSLFPWFSSVKRGQGFHPRVSFSQAFCYSGLWRRGAGGVGCLPAPSSLKLLVLAQLLGPGIQDVVCIHPGWVCGRLKPPSCAFWLGRWSLCINQLCSDFSWVLDQSLLSPQQSLLILKAGKSGFPFPVMPCLPVLLKCFLWSSLKSSCFPSDICCSVIVVQCSHVFIEFVWGLLIECVFLWSFRGQYRVIYMTPEFCSGNLKLLQDLHQTVGKLEIRLRVSCKDNYV